MTEDGWTEWKGGFCPVAADQRVEVRRRNGHVSIGYGRTFYWTIKNWPGDILAYRVTSKKHRMAP